MKKLMLLATLIAFISMPYITEAKKKHHKEENSTEGSPKKQEHSDCKGFYVGKTFKDEGKWGQYNSSKIVGIDKEENVLSIEISFWAGGKETREDTCTHVRELMAAGTVHEN
jgi:hypothetical protein